MQSDRHKRQSISYYCERPIRYKLDDNQSNADWRWALENIQAQLPCSACPIKTRLVQTANTFGRASQFREGQHKGHFVLVLKWH